MHLKFLCLALFALSPFLMADEMGQFTKDDIRVEASDRVKRLSKLTEKELQSASLEERNMNLVLRLYEEQNPDNVDTYFTKPLHIQELSTGQDETVNSVKEFDVQWAKAFTQTKMSVNEIFAGKEHVVVHWTWFAIHNKGQWHGIPITNKAVAVQGITLYQIRDNKISSMVQSSDNLHLLESLK